MMRFLTGFRPEKLDQMKKINFGFFCCAATGAVIQIIKQGQMGHF